MQSNFALYKKERENINTFETSEGFMTYRLNGAECYMIDFFIRTECRRTGKGWDLADKVAEIAKQAGCTYLLGSIDVSTNKCTESLQALLAYGFKLKSLMGNMIYLVKELQ